MKYLLRENIETDFEMMKQYKLAEKLGIHRVTLSNILNRKTLVDKSLAFYITYLNGGTEKDIEKYFELIKDYKKEN